MPDATQILIFISQVLKAPIQLVGAFVTAFFLTLFVLFLIVEMFNDANQRNRR